MVTMPPSDESDSPFFAEEHPLPPVDGWLAYYEGMLPPAGDAATVCRCDSCGYAEARKIARKKCFFCGGKQIKYTPGAPGHDRALADLKTRLRNEAISAAMMDADIRESGGKENETPSTLSATEKGAAMGIRIVR